MTKEALRLALGALQRFIKYDYNENPFDGKDVEGAEAITAIKEALAQPEHIGFMDSKLNPIQRTWVELTDEEVGDLSDFAYANDAEFVRNVEAKLKEKNT